MPFLDNAEVFAVVSTAGALVAGRGVTPARTGAGVYTLTLDRPLDVNEGMLLFEIRTAAIDEPIRVVHTSDTVKTVSSFDGGAATDCDFAVTVLRLDR